MLVLSTNGLVQAQATTKTVEAPQASKDSDPSEAGKPATGTLVIIADGEPDSKDSTVKTQVVEGAIAVLKAKNPQAANPSFDEKNVRVESLPREDYDRLSMFILGGKLPDKGDEGKAELKPDIHGSWILNLGGPYSLSKLEVEYEDTKTGQKATEEFKPNVEGVEGGRYRMKTLGRYLVDGVTKPNSNRRPIRFLATPSDGLKILEKLSFEVPQEKTHWMITLDGFNESDHMALFDKLADPETFANPLVSKKVSARKLVLGSMVVGFTPPDVSIVDGKATFRFSRPPGSKANRVWMKFPLTETEARNEVSDWRAKYDQFVTPKQIRKEAEKQSVGGRQLVVRTSGSTSGTWYEIPPSVDGLGFEREFTLDKIGTWKEQAKQAPWQLVVYELEPNGVIPQAYLILDDPKSGANRKFPIRAEKVASWPVNLESGAK